MRDVKPRLQSGWICGLVTLFLGLSLTGCAAVTQDVDAYYRQMAVNYQEAIDKAKIDELTLQKEARALAVTGDKANYRKAQRELGRIRSWEDHCEWERKRFAKAANWMESHFNIDGKTTGDRSGKPNSSDSAGSSRPEPNMAREIKDTPVE